MTIQEFIDSLPVEQKIEALSCKNAQELIAFASREKLAIPDDVLDNIAGGYGGSEGTGIDTRVAPPRCPDCGSSNTHVAYYAEYAYYCSKCGCQFG